MGISEQNDNVQTPPGMKRCDMCHEFVLIQEFDVHYEQHQGTETDGQLSTYPTLPPEQRWRGDLSTIPQSYLHEACGAVTKMPEDIIRTYMVNPYFYGYSSFCCGCGTHVPARKLKWVETGENMFAHTKELQATLPNAKRYRNELLKSIAGVSVLCGLVLGLAFGIGIYFLDRHIVGSLVASVVGFFSGILLCIGGIHSVRGGI